MKKALFLIIGLLTVQMLRAQEMHWTPIDEGLYSGSTTIIAVVKVAGVEQYSDQMEVAVFCGNECRGTAMTSEFFLSHRYLAQVNVYGENGQGLTFKAFDHATHRELEMDPLIAIEFTEDGSGSPIDPLELDFAFSEPSLVMHWIPVDEGLYSGSTTIVAIVKIDGVEQYSEQMEVAVFSGDECRGTAMTGEFFLTHRYLAQVNVYGENGHQLTFKAFNHATNQELEMDPVISVQFTEDGNGIPLVPLELNFAAPEPVLVMHWSPIDEGLYSGSTTIVAIVKINGVEQYSDQMELAVFSGDECRGTAMTSEFFLTHRYLAQVNVYGENGHELTFKAYNHATEQELEMDPVVTVSFTEDGSGNALAPLELNFTSTIGPTTVTQTIELTEGWNWISTYIEAEDPVELLQMLEAALGENASQISSAELFTENDGGDWWGDLDEEGVTNEQMYMILVETPCTIELEGMPANTADHAITINPGWNWIGFPCDHEMTIEEALGSFDAEEGDVFANSELFTEFDGEWFGDVETLLPGQGFMYYSNSEETKTLIIGGGKLLPLQPK